MRLWLFVAGLTMALGMSAQADTLRVLFIGNSLTYVNDLPGTFTALAQSGGRTVIAGSHTVGGYALWQHRTDSITLSMIDQDSWNYDVLQEQSQIPTIPYWRDSSMYPSACFLDTLIRGHGARTAFYTTWGWRDGGVQVYNGDSSPPFHDYFEMQDSVRTAYTRISDELSATLVPVGVAWARARTRDSLVGLWQSDCCHPTVEGTYLTACVFYARLFGADPRGLTYSDGLSDSTASFCQDVAWQTVLGITEQPAFGELPAASVHVHPNPFARSVTIDYVLPRAGGVSVSILDAQGRLVRKLPSCGSGSVSWNGTDERGQELPAGVYFVSAQSGGRTWTARLVMLR